MNNINTHERLGTKWFTFYTKVRPWFALLSTFSVLSEFMAYPNVYTTYWWLMVYFLGSILQAVLAIMVFAKSLSYYGEFVDFVKVVLLFETINLSYSLAVRQYISSYFDMGRAFVGGIITLLLGYFVWYRLNIKYFEKRIDYMTNSDEAEYIEGDFNEEPVPEGGWRCSCGRPHHRYESSCVCGKSKLDNLQKSIAEENDGRIPFCRKCGAKITEGALFCSQCGTEIAKK